MRHDDQTNILTWSTYKEVSAGSIKFNIPKVKSLLSSVQRAHAVPCK